MSRRASVVDRLEIVAAPAAFLALSFISSCPPSPLGALQQSRHAVVLHLSPLLDLLPPPPPTDLNIAAAESPHLASLGQLLLRVRRRTEPWSIVAAGGPDLARCRARVAVRAAPPPGAS